MKERWRQAKGNDIRQGARVRIEFYDGRIQTGRIGRRWRGWDSRIDFDGGGIYRLHGRDGVGGFAEVTKLEVLDR